MHYRRDLNLILRQRIKMFVVMMNILAGIMYLIYTFQFPINDDVKGGKLTKLYVIIMILHIVSGFLVICAVFIVA